MRTVFIALAFLLLLGCAAQQPAPPAGAPPPQVPSTVPAPPPAPGPTPAEQPPAQPPAQPPPPPPPPSGLKWKEISYTSGAWKIYGTLYEPVNKAATKVIVLLPGLGETRGVYPNTLIQKLHDQIPDAVVLAIDMRGHGDSTNLGTWKDFGTAEFKDMKTDVLSVPEYIDPYYPNVKDYYVVGASMGSSAALNAGAQKNQITKIAMISPGIEYEGVNLERAADDYVHPLLLVAASGDSYSASSAGQIKSISPRPNVELKIYQGISAHGTDLFGATQSYEDSLEDELVEFLK